MTLLGRYLLLSLACRAILTGTSLSALQYNKMVFQLSELYSRLFNEEMPTTPYALLGSRLPVQRLELLQSLSKVIEEMLSSGELTASQAALGQVTMEKIRSLELAASS